MAALSHTGHCQGSAASEPLQPSRTQACLPASVCPHVSPTGAGYGGQHMGPALRLYSVSGPDPGH